MFTGIIEELGTVRSLEVIEGEWGRTTRLSINARKVLEGSYLGASIAVNGCCLTLVDRGHDLDEEWWATDLSEETMRRTALSRLRAGDRVNLERPMALGERLGGHLVLGHVDCTGEIVEPAPELVVRLPTEKMRYLVEKGSIAVDGVSLTGYDLTDDTVRIAVIPHTADATTLGRAAPGTAVNIEIDIIAKQVERLMDLYWP
jgi:riboflavin synthase